MQKKGNAEKKWLLRYDGTEDSRQAVKAISEQIGVSPVMAQLLVNRGYRDPASAAAFIRMESELLCNPLELADVEKAVNRLRLAVERGEKIAVYGDYDVDGVTAVCTLYLYLTSLGADVEYYIPNRNGEGYGVSNRAIDTLHSHGVSLIVTVDTGITALDEVLYAKELGIDFVISDHHECREELPKAVAVVNPHRPDCPYPFKDLAGVGVVFKLVCAYEELTTGDSRRECVARLCHGYADLVAIGTIADVMPLRDENKLIVKYGLSLIEKRRRLGLSALIDASVAKNDGGSRRRSEPKITSGMIGFTIAPRLNAAGRVRSASLAVELLLSETKEKADALAAELCEANKERQNEENRIMQEAFAKIEAEHDFSRDAVIVLDADSWHQGVIGIVSSRVTERYGLPSILITFEGGGDMGKGSGRSVHGLNLVEALVHCSDTLVKHGGHALAAGLSIERDKVPAFRRKINEYAAMHLSEEDLIPTVEADCVLTMEQIHMDLASELRLLEPYGVENPSPVFAMMGVRAENIAGVGGGKHTRLTVCDGERHINAMYFSRSPESLDLYVGEKIDILFSIDINEWNGKHTVQLTVKDLRPALSEKERKKSERARYLEILEGADFKAEEKVIPVRDDFAAVYNLVRGSVKEGEDSLSARVFLSRLHALGKDVGYVKLRMILSIFAEMGLLKVEEPEEDVFSFAVIQTASKIDLEKSRLLHQLQSNIVS
ncbi:MAG: single-stranded-DNA-specific exonuclease RecJ [Clostridia bacterium]|nr:single-stranded-DNA-specific exonuclease RecJ [Clostridia bacterium]